MEGGGERNEAMIDHYYNLWILNPYSLECYYKLYDIMFFAHFPNTYAILMQNEMVISYEQTLHSKWPKQENRATV